MVLIRLPDDPNSNIDLAVGHPIGCYHRFVFLIDFEDPIELFFRDRLFLVDDYGRKTDDSITFVVNKDRQRVAVVLIQLRVDLTDCSVIVEETVIYMPDPLVAHVDVVSAVMLVHLIQRLLHVGQRDRHLLDGLPLHFLSGEILPDFQSLRDDLALELKDLADQLHDKEERDQRDRDLDWDIQIFDVVEHL